MKKTAITLLCMMSIVSSCAYQLDSIDEQARTLFYHNIKSVVVVPFIDQSGNPEIAGEATEVFTAELGRFREVNVVHSDTVDRYLKSNQLQVTPENLLQISEDLAAFFGVEAAIIGTVTEFDIYYPPLMGLSLELIVFPSEENILSFGQTYDSNLNYVREALKKYASSRNTKDSVFGEEAVLRKKADFIQFVCHEIIRKSL